MEWARRTGCSLGWCGSSSRIHDYRVCECGMYCRLHCASRRIQSSYIGSKLGRGGSWRRLWWSRRGRMPRYMRSWWSKRTCSWNFTDCSLCGLGQGRMWAQWAKWCKSSGRACWGRTCSCRIRCNWLPRDSDGPSWGCTYCTANSDGIGLALPYSTIDKFSRHHTFSSLLTFASACSRGGSIGYCGWDHQICFRFQAARVGLPLSAGTCSPRAQSPLDLSCCVQSYCLRTCLQVVLPVSLLDDGEDLLTRFHCRLRTGQCSYPTLCDQGCFRGSFLWYGRSRQ